MVVGLQAFQVKPLCGKFVLNHRSGYCVLAGRNARGYLENCVSGKWRRAVKELQKIE
jgi:hypothetical protein